MNKVRIIAVTLIVGALTLCFGAGYRHAGADWLLSAAITFGTFFYHLAMRLVVGAAVPVPKRTDSRWFQPRSFERELYRVLKVRQWKGHLPTFLPEQFSLGQAGIEGVLRNSCKAEIVHELIMVLSFLPVLAIPNLGAPGVFWATSVLSALFDGCFVAIQRYNRPRLLRLAKKEAIRHE